TRSHVTPRSSLKSLPEAPLAAARWPSTALWVCAAAEPRHSASRTATALIDAAALSLIGPPLARKRRAWSHWELQSCAALRQRRQYADVPSELTRRGAACEDIFTVKILYGRSNPRSLVASPRRRSCPPP